MHFALHIIFFVIYGLIRIGHLTCFAVTYHSSLFPVTARSSFRWFCLFIYWPSYSGIFTSGYHFLYLELSDLVLAIHVTSQLIRLLFNVATYHIRWLLRTWYYYLLATDKPLVSMCRLWFCSGPNIICRKTSRIYIVMCCSGFSYPMHNLWIYLKLPII